MLFNIDITVNTLSANVISITPEKRYYEKITPGIGRDSLLHDLVLRRIYNHPRLHTRHLLTCMMYTHLLAPSKWQRYMNADKSSRVRSHRTAKC